MTPRLLGSIHYYDDEVFNDYIMLCCNSQESEVVGMIWKEEKSNCAYLFLFDSVEVELVGVKRLN